MTFFGKNVSGRESVQIFNCLFVSVFPLEIQLSRVDSFLCLFKSRIFNVIYCVLFMFNDLRREVIFLLC